MQELSDLGYSPIKKILDQAAQRIGAGHWDQMARFPEQSRIDAVFVSMFTQGWQYVTQITVLATPEHLAHGFAKAPRRDGVEGIHVNCFNYAGILKEALELVGVQDMEIVTKVAKPNEVFVTKRLGFGHANVQGEFRCIDRAVKGNVRTANSTYAVEGRCCFSQHSALRVGNKVYDPTLRAVYLNGLEDCIDFFLFADPLQDDTWDEIPPGAVQRHLTRLPNEKPTGFGTGYLLH